MGERKIDSYLAEEKNRQLEELKDWLRVPSVSAQSNHRGDMVRAATWLSDHLVSLKLHNVEVIETGGHPLVYAEWLEAGDDKPTVLIYGHYDVQPVDPIDKWNSPPFEPTLRNSDRGEDLFARGACDDKGQVFATVKALEAILDTEKTLPVNVKLLVEGEEEVGSKGITKYVKENGDKLKADVCMISDTAIIAPDKPSIDYGLRGICMGELSVRGPTTDLHSGGFGGAVQNPNQALSKILATFHDDSGRVAVEGFYNGVRVLSKEERKLLGKNPQNEKELIRTSGVKQQWGEPEFSIVERLGARPTLEINGMWGGYTGEGFKTVIPAEARAKISCRLVPNQDPKQVAKALTNHIDKVAPKAVEATFEYMDGARATLIDPSTKEMQAAMKAYEQGFGVKPLLNLCGGGIPIVSVFQTTLETPVVLMGFGLPDDNAHAPNERIHLPNFYNGIKTVISFFKELS